MYSIMHIDIDDDLSRTLIHKWLRMAYALAQNRSEYPFGAEGILVLQGEQGIGKTALCSKLGINSELCKTGLCIDTKDKDTIIRATSCFVGELGEIGYTLRSDIDRLKAFITESTDRYRVPYGKTDVSMVRRASFIATTNDERFLIDLTGSRRFWTVPCKAKFDLTALNHLDIGQLWKQIEAEMVGYEYSAAFGSPFQSAFRLNDEEKKLLGDRNSVVEKLIKSEQEIIDIIQTAQHNINSYEWKKTTITNWKSLYPTLQRFTAEEIGRALKHQGLQKQSGRIGGTPHNNCYELPIPNAVKSNGEWLYFDDSDDGDREYDVF